MRRVVIRLLTQKGYTCDEAADAAEVRARLTGQEYDVLISDIDMPGNARLEMIADLRQVQSGLPIIILTGAPTMETAVQCIRLSVAGYLLKPVTAAELLSQVSQAVERRRVARSISAMRERLRHACDELAGIEGTLDGAGSAPVQASAQAFLGVAFQNAAQSLVEVRRVLEALSAGPGPGAGESPTPLSRYLALVQTLSETVTVLERTKSAFKSKELAELRRKIEGLLRSDAEPDSPSGAHS